MSRWFRFFIAILIGIAAGLLYGWVVSPIEYVDTSPETMRIDYKTDYVLMVAEAYRLENDVPLAVRRLAFLGSGLPGETALQAILFAERAGYTDSDLALMRGLSEALQTYKPPMETPTP